MEVVRSDGAENVRKLVETEETDQKKELKSRKSGSGKNRSKHKVIFDNMTRAKVVKQALATPPRVIKNYHRELKLWQKTIELSIEIRLKGRSPRMAKGQIKKEQGAGKVSPDINYSNIVREQKHPLYRSSQSEKSDRHLIRKINNSYLGKKKLLKQLTENKLQALQEREEKLEVENPQYKKKFKHQLLAEIKEECERRDREAQAEREKMVEDNEQF
ncbi:10320_t:CDS:2 [Funneliformis geosporum]|nr:10320_t:CDS:2 [Funneliformis geosporum]